MIFLLPTVSFAAEKVFFVTTDPAGTPVAMRDAATGNVVWRADYKPFGQEQSISGSLENNERFVGKEKDKETGLQYFGARYVKNEIGRFISPDPVGPVDPRTGKANQRVIHNPQMLNPYAYAGNNPYSYVDPLGLFWEYAQTTGQLTHVTNQISLSIAHSPSTPMHETETRTPVGIGYSGHGLGRNNPEMQDVQNIGPIPRGTWTIGPQQDNTTGLGHNLPASMRLTPENGTNTFERTGFLIHGDNSRRNQSASEGCIILNRDIRNQIGNSGDNELRVIQ